MKLILKFVILLAMFSCKTQSYHSPINKHYRPISKIILDSNRPLGSDTANYLNYNFVKYKNLYIGKKFSFLYRDLRIKIISTDSKKIIRNDNNHYEVSMRFCSSTAYSSCGTAMFYTFDILFEDSIIPNYGKVKIEHNHLWSEEQYETVKDRIIKDISIHQ